MSDCFDHMADAWDDALFGATNHGLSEKNRRDDYFRHFSYRRFPSCNRCGATRLVWFHNGLRYILVNPKGNKPHRCDPNKIHAKIANEFEVIE